MKKDMVSLESVKTIAFVMSPRLGDCLLSMIVTHNLRRNGFKVTAFSNFLTAMRTYFPEEDIQPHPDPAVRQNLLNSFDLLIYMADYNVTGDVKSHPRLVILDDYALYHRPISMVEIQLAVCREIFNLADIVRTNGLAPRAGLAFRKHTQRVAIHPGGSSRYKRWPAKRFIALAQQLKHQGYHPVFVIAATEKEKFCWIMEQGLAYVAEPSLERLPEFLYESGWFIGNDSGIGHLASNLGIPTLTLLGRQSVRRRWRPGWAPGKALLPRTPLLLRRWKIRYWRYFISVSRVMRTFNEMTKSVMLTQ